MLNRRVAGLVFVGLVASWPGEVAAWPEAPLCALREPEVETGAAPQSFLDPQPLATFTEPIPWTAPLTFADARRAYRQAEYLSDAHRPADALLQLRLVAQALPSLSDRIALREGDLLMQLGQPEPACRAYETARNSPHRSVAAMARVGIVRCELERDTPTAERHLQELLQRYPRLDELVDLRLSQARHRERRNNLWGAAALYKTIDAQHPGSHEARVARNALARLAASGMTIRPLSAVEQVDRAERLVRSGPVAMARATVDEMLDDQRLPAVQRARAFLLAAKMARIEGRWDDASNAVSEARRLGAGAAESARLLPPPAPARDLALREQAVRLARVKLRSIQRRRPLMRLPHMRLRAMLRIAVDHELRDEANEIMQVVSKRSSFTAAARFDAALEAIGLVDDQLIADTLESVINVPRYRLSGRYHYARALERSGRVAEARPQYQKIIAIDQTSTRYYAMWSEQRLAALANGSQHDCQAGACLQAGLLREPLTQLDADAERVDRVARREIVQLLRPLADKYAEPFPWLQRALDLARLGDLRAAADEINECYLAYRDALGSLRFRSGLESVFTGRAPARRGGDMKIRWARRRLAQQDRTTLAQVAERLGDPGTALRLGTWAPNERPRAYPEAVQRAAAEHGIDPNLLYAVMRVESIYNPRIISHVGAVGLMQIMPRTGRLIADRLGVEDFEVTDLLQPTTNLRFAAWYLRSLIERFDGRLPLAIASYNGGPHNVRLWLRSRPLDMPLDAFLEHIPFSQTHRYVRRVLTHYAAYRAQRGLPMPPLDVSLPDAGPDRMAF